MTETLDDQVQRIKDRIAAAQRQQAKAQHERDAATKTFLQAMAILEREFEVTTVEEAHDLVRELETRLARHITQLQAELDVAEA